MSLDLKPVQVRLSEEAYEGLRMIADANGQDLGEVARELLTDVLLGKAHGIKILAERLSRAITSGSKR
jgi:hypothetical protein